MIHPTSAWNNAKRIRAVAAGKARDGRVGWRPGPQSLGRLRGVAFLCTLLFLSWGSVGEAAFDIVEAGEPVIVTEAPAADFRAAWQLAETVKIIGDSSAGLGRADSIYLFDDGKTRSKDLQPNWQKFRTMVISLPVPPSTNEGLFLPVVTNRLANSSVVQSSAVWKYLDDGGAGLDPSWRSPGFDDGAWKSGSAPLGYGDPSAVKTEIGYGGDAQNKHITTYFRRAFTLLNPADYRTFMLEVMRDDGVVIYLNGVEVYRNNMPYGEISPSTLSLTAVGGADESAYHQVMLDASLFSSGQNILAVEIHQRSADSSDLRFDLSLQPAALVTLVPAGAKWRYLDTGTDPGTSWRQPQFDDSGWAQGNAQLGYGDSDETTEVGFGGDAQKKHITTYFRHRFTIGNPALYEQIEVTLLRDDGAVVYLNGSEILRGNMPAGAIDPSTPAQSAIGGIDETIFQRQTVSASLLHTGENVLAVEVHQNNGASSDLSFDLSMRSLPPSNADAVRFAVIGDFGTQDQNELAVAKLIASWAPQFVITLGDNRYALTTYDGVIGQYFCAFLKGVGSGAHCAGDNGGINGFFPATGNHDYSDGGKIAEYLAYFTSLPGIGVTNPNPTGNRLYYDFVHGPVHFFVVDSQSAIGDPANLALQKDWLQKGLAAATSPWQIVYFHHPPFSSGQHLDNPKMQWPYAEWGADLVLAGHDHNYERIVREGIPHIVNGSGGAGLRPMRTIVAGSEAINFTEHGAMWISADACSLWAQFVDTAGRVVDQFALTQPTCN